MNVYVDCIFICLSLGHVFQVSHSFDLVLIALRMTGCISTVQSDEYTLSRLLEKHPDPRKSTVEP